MKDKVVLITGAGNGIGRATAIEFAKRGARVIVADINRQDGEQTVQLIKKNDGQAWYIHTDVSVRESVANTIRKTILEQGTLDILYANAGIELQKCLIDTEENEWDKVIDVNLKGVYLCSREALKHFIPKKSGVILITASPHALATYEELAAYAASKGGVVALCRAMALENAKYGVRVNCILPGAIDTPMVQREIEASAEPEKLKKIISEMHPIGRMGLPEDIAKAAAFLVSEDASFITGTCLAVDGGVLAKLGS